MVGGTAFDWIRFAGFQLHLYSNQRSREHREWKRIFPLNHVKQLARSLNKFIDLGQLDSNLWSGKISDRNEVKS